MLNDWGKGAGTEQNRNPVPGPVPAASRLQVLLPAGQRIAAEQNLMMLSLEDYNLNTNDHNTPNAE
jgi:hypothetical protein